MGLSQKVRPFSLLIIRRILLITFHKMLIVNEINYIFLHYEKSKNKI